MADGGNRYIGIDLGTTYSAMAWLDAHGTPVERHEFPLTSISHDVSRLKEEIATGRGFSRWIEFLVPVTLKRGDSGSQEKSKQAD